VVRAFGSLMLMLVEVLSRIFPGEIYSYFWVTAGLSYVIYSLEFKKSLPRLGKLFRILSCFHFFSSRFCEVRRYLVM